jgi:hypothetical protein
MRHIASASNGIGYLDAWKAWAHHQDINSRFLWHIQIYWWGRIGKLLELAGGMTVVATILGPSRLEAAAKALRENDVRKLATKLRADVPSLWRGYVNTIKGPAIQAIFAIVTLFTSLFFVGLGAFNGVTAGATALGGGLADVANYSSMASLFVVLLPALGLALILIVVVAGYALDIFVARPLAFGAKTATRESVVQGAGVLLLALGIHFDVLSV